MLKVTLTEAIRRFYLRVGEREVGKVEGSGEYYSAYKRVYEGGQWVYKYIDNQPSLRRAAQSILMDLNYGKSAGGVPRRERKVK